MAGARDCALLGAIGVCCTRDSPLWAPGARGFGAGIPNASAWAMVSARGAVCVLVICACVGTVCTDGALGVGRSCMKPIPKLMGRAGVTCGASIPCGVKPEASMKGVELGP